MTAGNLFKSVLILAAVIFLAAAEDTPEIEQPDSISSGSSQFVHSEEASCIECHSELKSRFPSIAQVRNEDCFSCHTGAFLNTEIGDWTHPVSDMTLAGKECLDCHSISAEGTAQMPDKTVGPCLDCHSSIRREIHLIGRHPVTEGITACLDCHPAHKPGKIALTYGQVQFLGASWIERHDPLKQNAACLSCHPYFSLTGLRSSGFVIANTVNLHEVHLERGFAACIECHTPHGSFAPKLVRDRIEDGTPLIYTQDTGMGTCSVKCHSHVHMQTRYGTDPEKLSAF